MGGEWSDALLDSIALSTDYVANGSFAMLRENVAYRNTPSYAILIRTVDFNNNWSGDYVWVDRSAFEFLSKSRLEPGDLVMSNVGSVGTVFRVPNLGQPMTLGPNAVMCRTRDTTRLDQRFLYYFFLAPQGQNKLREITSGSVQPKFNKTDLRSLCIPLPQIGEQRAIAHILGTLDDKIELNRQVSETLEAMARALFKSWFVDFEPVRAKMEGRWRKGESLPGLPADLWEVFPDRLVDSELGEIPEGWEVKKLAHIAENPRRTVRPGEIDSGVPYIALEHMPKRCIVLANWGTGDGVESNKFEFKQGEVLFGKLRPYFHKVGVAPVDGVCSTDIVVVVPRARSWFALVLGHLSSIEFVDYTNAGSTGTKMPRTSWEQMSHYELPLPLESVAAAFTKLIQPSVDRILAGIHESRTLSSLRDTLLPKLISGEIRVKDLQRFIGVVAT